MRVEFTYTNGKKKVMAETFAKTLQKMRLGTYQTAVITHTQHRQLQPNLFSTPANPQAGIQMVAQVSSGDADGDLLISDAVKKLAEDAGIDISSIRGTGAKGRINKHDVEDAIVQLKSLAPVSVPEAAAPTSSYSVSDSCSSGDSSSSSSSSD